MPRNCYNCNKDLARCWHGKCRRCKWAKYCSTSCQTKDWPLHKQWCRIACQPGNPVRQQGFTIVEMSSQRCESLMVEYMFQLLQEQHSHSQALGGFGNSSLCWLQLTSLCELAQSYMSGRLSSSQTLWYLHLTLNQYRHYSLSEEAEKRMCHHRHAEYLCGRELKGPGMVAFPEGELERPELLAGMEESMRAMEFALGNVLAAPFAEVRPDRPETPIHQPDESSSSSEIAP